MRIHKNRYAVISVGLLSLILASSCTKKESAPAPESSTAATTATTGATTQSAAPASGKVEQEITIGTDGDNLYFDKKEFDAKAGSTVKITFKNNASAASNLAHNLVVVKPGTADDVANESMQAGETKGWVAEGPNVLGHTPLTTPGKSESFTVTFPTAGDYPYICSFPGHPVTMKGVIHVK